MESPADVKELIPEFFYFPEFLQNMNGEGGLTWEKIDYLKATELAVDIQVFV